MAEDLRHLLARYGLPSLEAAIGRTDLLEQVRFEGNLDLQPMLETVNEGPRRWMGVRNDRPETVAPTDEAWVAPAIAALHAGEKYVVHSKVDNGDRSLGAPACRRVCPEPGRRWRGYSGCGSFTWRGSRGSRLGRLR